MTIIPRNYAGQSGHLTADGILRFAVNPRLYQRMKNQQARLKCRKQGICMACRTEPAAKGHTKCKGCLSSNAEKQKHRRARA